MDIPDLPEMKINLRPDYGEESQWRGRGSEVTLCRERLLSFCRGVGLDLGCGSDKIRKEAIGIDIADKSCAQMVRDISDLSPFASNSFDYVFSSHALEDIANYRKALTEWLRVLRLGGYLVLYGPDKQYYYNIGHSRANQQHKHDFYWWDIARVIDTINPKCELVHYGRYGPVYLTGEWSWDLVVRKL